jgi:hypothetical protein
MCALREVPGPAGGPSEGRRNGNGQTILVRPIKDLGRWEYWTELDFGTSANTVPSPVRCPTPLVHSAS